MSVAKSTFLELRRLLGVLSFSAMLCLLGAWLCFHWAKEIPSMDHWGQWCQTCKKVTYLSDRKIKKFSDGDAWVCETCDMSNLTTYAQAMQAVWICTGSAMLIFLVEVALFGFVWKLNSQDAL